MLKIIVSSLKFQVRSYCQDINIPIIPLTTRLYRYLNGNRITSKCGAEIEKSPVILSLEAIKSIDNKFKNKLRAISEDPESVFGLVDNLFETKPYLLTRLKYFNEALNILIKNIEHDFNKKDFLKICFYLSFYKKNDSGRDVMTKLLNKHLNKLLKMELTSMDLAILCSASYKSSVRINIDKFNELAVEELLATRDDDTFLFVAFIKSLRLNRIKSKKVFDKLMELDCTKHDYRSLIHIFPYIADNGMNNEKVNQKLVKRCIETFDEKARTKDIQKMLHSCALLNLKMDKSELSKIEDLVIARTTNFEYDKFFDHYVNSALSLWILDFKCIKLSRILLSDERFCSSGDKSRIKLDSRMKLLKTCLEIESPELLLDSSNSFDETRPSPGYLIKTSLKRVMTERFNNHKNVSFVQPILNLNIAGILVTNDNDGSRTHYEVLDNLTSLSDKSPNGLMQLKLRLLQSKKCTYELIKVD